MDQEIEKGGEGRHSSPLKKKMFELRPEWNKGRSYL